MILLIFGFRIPLLQLSFTYHTFVSPIRKMLSKFLWFLGGVGLVFGQVQYMVGLKTFVKELY
jgi:hypothetical protein